MSASEKTSPAAIDPELLAFLNGPPPQEPDWSAIGSRYCLSLSVTERVDRHDEARRVIELLEAIAHRHGIRAPYWMITGPVQSDAPDLGRVRDLVQAASEAKKTNHTTQKAK